MRVVRICASLREPWKQPFLNGCFNWMMNQIFTGWWFFHQPQLKNYATVQNGSFLQVSGWKFKNTNWHHHPGNSGLIVTSIPPGKDPWRLLLPMYCFVTTKTNRHLLGVAPFTTVYLKLTYTVYLYQLQRRRPSKTDVIWWASLKSVWPAAVV